jgi:hypothetical protein
MPSTIVKIGQALPNPTESKCIPHALILTPHEKNSQKKETHASWMRSWHSTATP